MLLSQFGNNHRPQPQLQQQPQQQQPQPQQQPQQQQQHISDSATSTQSFYPPITTANELTQSQYVSVSSPIDSTSIANVLVPTTQSSFVAVTTIPNEPTSTTNHPTQSSYVAVTTASNQLNSTSITSSFPLYLPIQSSQNLLPQSQDPMMSQPSLSLSSSHPTNTNIMVPVPVQSLLHFPPTSLSQPTLSAASDSSPLSLSVEQQPLSIVLNTIGYQTTPEIVGFLT